MVKKTKKVILFIVEGVTDEDALSPVLKKIFHKEEVRFHVVHGDITTERLINSTNAILTINEVIRSEMKRYGFRNEDILKVIHIIDTDGAFIPATHVIEGKVDKIRYEDHRIITKNPQAIIDRNRKKSIVVQKLYPAGKIGVLSYFVYYFSRNMEHVLHNISKSLSSNDKVDYADLFADTYDKNPEAFKCFLRKSEFTVSNDYDESWRFIFIGTNSLHRHSNLHLLFEADA